MSPDNRDWHIVWRWHRIPTEAAIISGCWVGILFGLIRSLSLSLRNSDSEVTLMSIWIYGDVSREPHHVWSGNTCTFGHGEMKLLHHQADDINTVKSRGSYTKRVFACGICGWWKAEAYEDIDAFVHHTHFQSLRGAAASLRELDLTNIRTPLQEIRSYLSAKYEQRFKLHPKLFEETIASVFRDLGYSAEATAFSGDDGIDVILKKGNETIGVQAKRYKGSIEVDQIRSLAGALVFHGLTRGIFVTTSGFQSGGTRTTGQYKARGYEIELYDAERFYEALKIAQRNMYGSLEELPVAEVLSHLAKIEDYATDRLAFERWRRDL